MLFNNKDTRVKNFDSVFFFLFFVFFFFFCCCFFFSCFILFFVFKSREKIEHFDIKAMLCLVDSSAITLWIGPASNEGVSYLFLLLPYFVEIPAFNANSVDPDQTRVLRPLVWVYTVCHCHF